MTDPKDYRERASHCIEMANVSHDTREHQAECKSPMHEIARGRPGGN